MRKARTALAAAGGVAHAHHEKGHRHAREALLEGGGQEHRLSVERPRPCLRHAQHRPFAQPLVDEAGQDQAALIQDEVARVLLLRHHGDQDLAQLRLCRCGLEGRGVAARPSRDRKQARDVLAHPRIARHHLGEIRLRVEPLPERRGARGERRTQRLLQPNLNRGCDRPVGPHPDAGDERQGEERPGPGRKSSGARLSHGARLYRNRPASRPVLGIKALPR